MISLAFVFLYKTTASVKWLMGTIMVVLLAALFIILVFGYLVAKFTCAEDTLPNRLASGISIKLAEWGRWLKEHVFYRWRKNFGQL